MASPIRDKVRDAQDITSELIDVAQWDVKVEVRSMNGLARSKILKEAAQADGRMDFEKLYPAIIIACCYDPEEGVPIFEIGDEAMINSKSAGPVEKLAQAGMRLSGLTAEALELGKEAS